MDGVAAGIVFRPRIGDLVQLGSLTVTVAERIEPDEPGDDDAVLIVRWSDEGTERRLAMMESTLEMVGPI